MPRRNLEYEHGYSEGYMYHQYAGGTEADAKREIVRRFGKKAIYSSYGKGFITGFLDHKEGKPQKYE